MGIDCLECDEMSPNQGASIVTYLGPGPKKIRKKRLKKKAAKKVLNIFSFITQSMNKAVGL